MTHPSGAIRHLYHAKVRYCAATEFRPDLFTYPETPLKNIFPARVLPETHTRNADGFTETVYLHLHIIQPNDPTPSSPIAVRDRFDT